MNPACENPKRAGSYLVLDRQYRDWSVGSYNPALGWCIRTRWLGHDAAEEWQELPIIRKEGGR